MTQKPYDQFAKQYLEELLSSFGEVEISREVTDEVRQVDVLFIPTLMLNAEVQTLGLLGKIVEKSCLLEPFSHQPSKTEVRNCILKLLSMFAEFQRKARRDRTSLTEDNLPYLWILATSASDSLLSSFRADLDLENWSTGVYLLGDSFKTAIVAINQLPVRPETLLLRILGRGKTFEQAIDELLELPETSQLRQNVQRLVSSWRIVAVEQDNITQDDREWIMALSKAFLDWEEKTRLEGRVEGRVEGQLLVLENLLKVRFGSVDDELAQVILPLLQLSPQEYTRLILELSREALLARFGTSRS
ncbi:MAG: hypothetical protein SAL70_27110 [Scytonema sp. PMC 1070.18]|nr:hypothetical protein [Scytonema sp. PMC 1070.18]